MIDYNCLFDIFHSVLFQLEEYVCRYGKYVEPEKKFYKRNNDDKIYRFKSKDELFYSLVNDVKLFEDKYIELLEKYGYIQFPKHFSKEVTFQHLSYFSEIIKEVEIKVIISRIKEIIQGQKPRPNPFFDEILSKNHKKGEDPNFLKTQILSNYIFENYKKKYRNENNSKVQNHFSNFVDKEEFELK